MYAVIPSRGCYGSGQTVRSEYGTHDRDSAIATARRMTAQYRRAMARHGETSGGYRAVETDELCRAGDVVADFGWQADMLPTVEEPCHATA